MTAVIQTTRVDRARQVARKVARNARDKNEWRKVIKVRLWMPVVLPRRVTVWFTAGVPAEVMSWLPTAPGLLMVVLV